MTRPSLLLYLSCLGLLCRFARASGSLFSPNSLATASIYHSYRSPSSARGRRRQSASASFTQGHRRRGLYGSPVQFASTKTLRSKQSTPSTTATPSSTATTSTETANDDLTIVAKPAVTYADLGILGKIVAGTMEITVAVAFEFVMGAVGGYVLGTVTDIPRFLFKPLNKPPAGFIEKLGERVGRTHQKSWTWARSWGSISAAFGGFRVGAKILRNGREDEWTTVLSSMAAGAYFARKGKENGCGSCEDLPE
jgi:Tim17/Tim22/Tim23/Pmp24 family